jgi:hypothetical protein
MSDSKQFPPKYPSKRWCSDAPPSVFHPHYVDPNCIERCIYSDVCRMDEFSNVQSRRRLEAKPLPLEHLEIECDEKMNRQSDYSHGKVQLGRRNAKEARRVAHLKHLAKIQKKKEAKLTNNVKPHALDLDDNDPYAEGEVCTTCNTQYCMHFPKPLVETVDEDEVSETLDFEPALADLRREEKRQLVAALDTPPQNILAESDDELATLMSTIHDVAGDSDGPEMNEWISHLENIVIMAYQVSRAQSFTDVFAAVVAYIKMNTQKSVLKQLLQLIDEVTTKCPASEVDAHAWNGEDVLQKWDLFKSNTIFKKISYLLSAAMSLSVCSMKQIEWSPFGLQLVSVEAAKQQLKAVDVIDAVIKTFTWMADTGYRVFEEKSLLPLLYSDNRMKAFNENCDYVLANAEQAVAGNLGEIADFEFKVDEVLKQVCEMKGLKDSGPTALWLQTRYAQLITIKHKIIAKHRNTAIRFAPMGVGLTGPSGVGKSTLAKLVMKTVLHAMGFSTDPRRIITKDMFDAYDSTYTSDILGMFMDDVGNGKAEFTKNSPTDVIIKFFNNMAAQAVKAELNAKGVVFIAFKCGVLTSNFPDYNVRLFTNKPEAALRRFVHTRVNIKPEFRKPGSVSLDTDHPDLQVAELTKDVWCLDLEECHIFENKKGKDDYQFRILTVTTLDGRKIYCKDIGLGDYLDALIALSVKHQKAQKNVMARSDNFDLMAMCDTCKRPESLCRCVEKVEPHAFEAIGEVMVQAAKSSVTSYVNKWLSPVNFLNSMIGFKPVKLLATKQLASEMRQVLNDTATPWMVAVTPDWLFRTSVFRKSMDLWQHSAAVYDLRSQMKFGSLFAVGLMILGAIRKDMYITGGAFVGAWLFSMITWSQYRARVEHYRREYLLRRDALPVHAQALRDGNLAKGIFLVSTLVVGLKLFSMWNNARVKNLNITPDSVNTDDNQPGWFGFMMAKMGMNVGTSPGVKHTVPLQIEEAFRKNNLFWADFERADGTKTRCNIFFPRKGVACFPRHIFYPDADLTKTPTPLLIVTVTRHNKSGGVFTFKSELDFCSTTDELDMVCAFAPNCPDLKTRISWLPTTKPTGTGMCNFLVQHRGDFQKERVAVEFGTYGHKYADFYGGSYTTKFSRTGACMGILITDTKSPVIVGFHIGGNTPAKYGVMQTVTQDMAKNLIEELSRKPGVNLPAEATDLPLSQYGVTLIDKKDVHPNCMASKLDSKAYIDVLGSTRLRTKQRSTVEKSILSDAVDEVCKVPNLWGPPQLEPNWKGYNATLEHIVSPADMFAPSALERARQDYLSDLIPLMMEHRQKEDFRPLTLKESVLGIEGKRFIDAIPMNTGCGAPLFGKKDKLFSEIRDGQTLIDRVPKPELQAEMDRMQGCWERGERAYPVTAATLKDEPTPIEKEKVRVFQAVAVAFGLKVRKYFLPIARFLSLHPEVSESAVGVNAFGPQWEELMDHANKFADDGQVIAWDYSKYDVRMNSQMTSAVLLSFIELAEIGGYPPEDIRIMKNMVTDLIHPLIDYNGTMIMAYNMNTSGNNITVNINSAAGSLYVRLGFFNECPEVLKFRSAVAAMTYGDDFLGSVLRKYRERFNFLTYQKFLLAHKMKITLPDKKSDAVAFMDSEDADFLKRQSNFIPEIGCKIGMLDEMSIFKSLHSNLRSKTALKTEVSVSCLETAMHEWFAHGREVYESRQLQMQRVCELVDLPVPAVNCSFDERAAHWHSKYLKST